MPSQPRGPSRPSIPRLAPRGPCGQWRPARGGFQCARLVLRSVGLGDVPVNANNHTDVELFRHKGATISALTPSQFDKGSVGFGFGFDTERIVLKPDNISLANFGHIHFGHLTLHHRAVCPLLHPIDNAKLARCAGCVNSKACPARSRIVATRAARAGAIIM